MRWIMLLFLAQPALATTQDEVMQARLLPGWTTTDGTLMAAIQIELAPGWKTYWRTPGEAGIPPSFDWSGSQNVAGVTLHWPTPEVFSVSGMRSIGYHDQLILPVEVTLAEDNAPVRLSASIDLGICKDICIPAHVTVSGNLPLPGAMDGTIAAALADQPRQATDIRAACTVAPSQDGVTVTATLDLPPSGRDEVAVIEPNTSGLWIGDAWSERRGDLLVATADLVAEGQDAFALDRSALSIVVIGDRGAVEIRGCDG
jgi:DsbC/DsbD-like thiol-disulfide interchange protein